MARSYLPPGFRFHPTDEELLVHYLKKKVAGRRVNNGVIGEIEIYKFEPADLPGMSIFPQILNCVAKFSFCASILTCMWMSRLVVCTYASMWIFGQKIRASACCCTIFAQRFCWNPRITCACM